MRVFTTVCAIIAAMIMLQTLFFKFSGAEESVFIFTRLHAEPFGRIGSGVAEAVASLLLLIPSKRYLGALLGIGIMTGAILAHLFVLGIAVLGDGGQLFIYAMITFVCCVIVLMKDKQKLLKLLPRK